MKILVASCDKNKDTFFPFHHCMEKYWIGHPEVIYSTESVVNPYYRTISKDYPLHQWTRRIRETLSMLKDDAILLMVDDAFIRQPVDKERIAEAVEILGDNACVNFEKVFDRANEPIPGHTFLKRMHGSAWEVSIMCGLWNREKLMDVLSEDMSPWDVERKQPTKGYTFLINGGDYIIDYGYRNGQYMGIHNGKWCRESIPFFQSEGIQVELSRGVE